MNLQASLHSHEDVITDIDISKCNRYLASASIDGKIIVWDWQNCKKLDEITDHRANVNNIKFFSLYTKTPSEENSMHEEIQILVSCSEDGTVRIYDEIAYLEQLANLDSPNQGRRSNRGRPPNGSSGQ
jgi:WD40 repeat protein